ncbi:hypothetical protein L3X38_042830 [Prunus dulcis]|uniref:Uncharacterized protein n=1 Tax=Prunus dulcis TaxID=3755 RepID=A0AAD4UX08_PRUDU|nr:hypothetical protein L3X38_042830 [Prunus dulcis]
MMMVQEKEGVGDCIQFVLPLPCSCLDSKGKSGASPVRSSLGFNPNGSSMKDKKGYEDGFREFFGYGIWGMAGLNFALLGSLPTWAISSSMLMVPVKCDSDTIEAVGVTRDDRGD